ncbi:hypothetical protein N665_0161s0051 [Sinapis alba]|nr:hypothetical protein N665_0772s0001 [Sinapis alba]KAF8105254.1 hypothetical protein N665_0161s0051 [Sinapis alba]
MEASLPPHCLCSSCSSPLWFAYSPGSSELLISFGERRSQRQPSRTSELDLKSANLGVALLPCCVFRRLLEALSFEDMLRFVLLCMVRFQSSVVSLCSCGAPALVLQALAGRL